MVPHNNIYQSKILEFFDTNYQPEIETVVILGTNHKDIGPPISQSDNDYSVQNIIPIVNKIYPKAKIVPYLLRPSRDIPRILSFSDSLKKNYDPNRSLIITSVDFSHYTFRPEADIFDQETVNAIKQRDYNQLINWGPEHTDCPDCLIISSDLNPNFTLINREYFEGTSYFFGYFR